MLNEGLTGSAINFGKVIGSGVGTVVSPTVTGLAFSAPHSHEPAERDGGDGDRDQDRCRFVHALGRQDFVQQTLARLNELADAKDRGLVMPLSNVPTGLILRFAQLLGDLRHAANDVIAETVGTLCFIVHVSASSY